MPARLNVIVSQAARQTSQAADLEENIVARLMMAGGMDVNLIGPLDNLQAGSTDALCLSGFAQDIVLLSWLGGDAVREHCERLGITGEVQPVTDRSRSRHGVRRILWADLSGFTDAEQVEATLQDILKDRQTAIFAIQVPTKTDSGLSAQRAQVGSDSPHSHLSDVTAGPASETDESASAQRSTRGAIGANDAEARDAEGHAMGLNLHNGAGDNGTGHSGAGDSQHVAMETPLEDLSNRAGATPPASTAAHSDADEDWPELDNLVDKLDALDL